MSVLPYGLVEPWVHQGQRTSQSTKKCKIALNLPYMVLLMLRSLFVVVVVVVMFFNSFSVVLVLQYKKNFNVTHLVDVLHFYGSNLQSD